MHEKKQAQKQEKNHVKPTSEASARADNNCTGKQVGGAGERSCLYVDLHKLPEEFYREMMPRLAWIAERAGMPRNECEDMAQEAWAQALANSEKFSGQHTLDEVYSWLAAIVHNLAANALNKRKAHPVQAFDESAVEPMDRKEAERVHLEEVIEQLTPLLDRLQREAPGNCQFVCERYLASRKVEEIAEETGLSAHEVSYRIHRSLRKMRSWKPKAGPLGEESME